jgi:hypothetical protein
VGKVVKSLGKAVKKVAAVAAPIIGGAVGGPIGAAIGGAVGGVVSGQGAKGALIGAGLSFAGATALQYAGASSSAGQIFSAGSNVSTGISLANVTAPGIQLLPSTGAAGIQVAPAAFDSALSASTGWWPSTAQLLGAANNVVKTVSAVNSLTGEKSRIDVNSPVPAGWTVDANQTPETVMFNSGTTPIGAATSSSQNQAAALPIVSGDSSGGSMLPLLGIGIVLLLLMRPH